MRIRPANRSFIRLAVLVIAWIIGANSAIFKRPATGPAVSALEILYYVIGVASIALGWYFNIQFVQQYADGSGNVFTGAGSWWQFITLGYANPAAASASQDYTIANVILLPLFTIIDGYRRGIRRPWLYFVSSLFTMSAVAVMASRTRICASVDATRSASDVLISRSFNTVSGCVSVLPFAERRTVYLPGRASGPSGEAGVRPGFALMSNS